MRANHKGFNITIRENYQDAIPQTMAVPQDLSRAVLNITNNACYTVWEKSQQAGADYVPTLDVSVTATDSTITIIIADNGMGMTPERLREVREALEEARLQGEGPAPDASGEEEGHRKVGIGVGNIYRRIYSLYRTGSMTIESTEGEGTEITLVIPQGEERNVPDSDRGR